MMDTEQRLAQWLQKMGYGGKLPENIKNICSPSTHFIWEQLITNVRPRQEADHIKTNLIVHNFQTEFHQDEFQVESGTREIAAYKKRLEMEKKIRLLKAEISDKDKKIDKLVADNNMKYITAKHLKQSIKENNEKTHLLNQKLKMLKDEMCHSEELKASVENLFLVETDNTSSESNVKEMLDKCAVKLEKLIIDQVSLNDQSNSNKSIFFNTIKTPSLSVQKNNFNKHLKSTNTVPKSSAQRLNKQLFVETEISLDCNVSRQGTTKDPDKRESLGLLLPGTLDSIDQFSFLNGSDVSSDSRQLFLKETVPVQSRSKCSNISLDKDLCDILKAFVRNVNPGALINAYKSTYREILEKVQNIGANYNSFETQTVICEQDLTDLYLLHVRNELLVLQYKNEMRKLQPTVKKRTDEIYSQLAASSSGIKLEDLRNSLDLQIEEVQTDIITKFLNREINSARATPLYDLQTISSHIKKKEEEIESKTISIENRIQRIFSAFHELKRTKDEAVFRLRDLTNFVVVMDWAEPLNKSMCFQEIDVFRRFPLEYNRKLNLDGKKIAARDLCNNVASDIVVDANNLHILSTIMNAPFQSPELIILDLLQSKLKLKALKAVNQSLNMTDYKEYCVTELRNREKYVDDIVEKLRTILDSGTVKETLSVVATIRETMELWTEMPFSRALSTCRQVNGHPVDYYEQLYDNLRPKFVRK